MSFANQALAAEHLVRCAGTLAPRRAPGAATRSTARSRGSSSPSLGVEIDALTDEQRAYLTSWSPPG